MTEPEWAHAPMTGRAEAEVPWKLRFHGRGDEYFGIWIVNLLLSIATLGIYSAWAKVRRLKYFHGATELDGARCDYHADPRRILTGRLIGLGLFTLYNLAWDFSLLGGVLMLLLMIVMLPLLLRSSFRFHARNSSYRALRFGFEGDLASAYQVFLLGPLLALLSLGLAAPWAYRQIKGYQHGRSRFGVTPFSFAAPLGPYCRVLAVVVVALVLSPIAFGLLFGMLMPEDGASADTGAQVEGVVTAAISVAAVMGLLYLLLGSYVAARLQNLNWSASGLDGLTFVSQLRVSDLFRVRAINLALITLTLGLFKPWADIREARLRVEAIGLSGEGDLGRHIQGLSQREPALGEETAEWFDLDIGL